MYGVQRRRSSTYSRGMSVSSRRAPRVSVKSSRSSSLFRGRGGYFGQKLGSKIGTWVGKPWGADPITAPIGGAIGSAVGDLADTALAMSGPYGRIASGLVNVAGGIARMTGRGAYVDNNLIVGGGPDPVPSFASSSDGNVITITHKEFIRDIKGSSNAFDLNVVQINPGIPACFPWLSQVAANFEEYQFKQLMFTYRSTTSDIGSSTNGQVGTVVMATNYNPAASVFATKLQMMEYDGAMSCKTTESMRHGVECDPKRNVGDGQKYVRTHSNIDYGEIRDYDLGRFQLAVCSSPSGFWDKSIGELWVTYTVVLSKPKLSVGLGSLVNNDEFALAKTQTHSFNGTGSSFTPFRDYTAAGLSIDTDTKMSVDNAMNCTLSVVDRMDGQWLEVKIPRGNLGYYELKYTMSRNTTTGSIQDWPNHIAGGNDIENISSVKAYYFGFNSPVPLSNAASSIGTAFESCITFKVTDPSAEAFIRLRINIVNLPAGAMHSFAPISQQLSIRQLDYDMFNHESKAIEWTKYASYL